MPGDQQIGDEIAAQHEKDVNPEETARRHAHPEVESDNDEHRKRPDAIETGNPAAHAQRGRGITRGITRDRHFFPGLPRLPGCASRPVGAFAGLVVLPDQRLRISPDSPGDDADVPPGIRVAATCGVIITLDACDDHFPDAGLIADLGHGKTRLTSRFREGFADTHTVPPGGLRGWPRYVRRRG